MLVMHNERQTAIFRLVAGLPGEWVPINLIPRAADWGDAKRMEAIKNAIYLLAGAVPETALDHVVFAGAAAAIRHVMVAGRWVIRDGRHAAEAALAERFADLMGGLA